MIGINNNRNQIQGEFADKLREEIYNKASEEVKRTYAFIHDEEFSCEDMADMFLKGAQYAGSHPRKGLWDAKKVVKWILENADNHIWYDETENDCGITDNFIEDLQKAMED